MKKSYILLIVVLAALIQYCGAQVDLTNTGTLRISNSSDILYINGNLTNNSGSALVNNGQLYIKGNLSNNQASMSAGTGILYLNGSGAQAVNGSQPFKTFNLNTNNAAGITLNNNLDISGAHTFTTGIILTSATPNYLIYEAGSSYSGSADAAHVNGWVKKIGGTDFIFPVGSATMQRTIELKSLSGSSEFNVKYLTNTTNAGQVQTPIQNVTSLEDWSINKVSGGSASVSMNWNNSKVAFPNWLLADISVGYYNGTTWTNAGGTASGNVTTTGIITSSSVSSFNYFTFASRTYPLPLTLISFTAKLMNNYTQLAWVTNNEQSMDHFAVERSDNGVSYYEVGQSPARNRGITEQYFMNDNVSINHIAYYRLRCVDIDKREKMSNIVKVAGTGVADYLTLLTNPVHDKIVVTAGIQLNGIFDYRINTMNGRQAQQGRLVIQNGGQYELPLKGNIVSGTYLLTISDDQHNFVYKLIVQ